MNAIQQDLVKIEIVFDAGKWFELKPEASHFTVQMLDKGTRSMSAKQIDELFDQYGAHLELSSNFDFASVSLYALSKHLAKLFPIFLELIISPSFNETELNLLKGQFIQGLRVKNEKTSYLASKLIRKRIFGSSHPYGQSANENDVNNLQVSDLKSFFDERMKPSFVFILGKINADDLKTLKQALGSIDINTLPVPDFSSSKEISTESHIDKKGSLQSSIRLGKKTLQRDHSDFAGILIINHYLGGYFGSRLMKNIREEKGLTYGISSSVNSFKNGSILLIGTDVNKENRLLAISEIVKEIDLLQSSIDSEELELAKRHFIGSLQGEMASPLSILGKVKNLELHQLPSNYYQVLIDKIDKV
ncbi:MAG: insulinase family protein, partial [Cyclobacteriaceae bacterium]|nr:insulinase family protein [Cyclobacteriaceae bacterium]